MKNSADMTTLSRYMYRTATSKKLSLQNAVKLLQSTAYVRTTKDILMKFSRLDPAKESELQAYVLDALLKTSDAIGRDSLRRKVSIWIKEGGAIGKDAAIQLAFAFGLSHDQADELLKYTRSEGFHWRDPEDIVFSYALLKGLSYQKACELKDRMAQAGLLSPVDTGAEAAVARTEQIRQKAENLDSEEELIAFLTANQSSLGTLHNTAYGYFTQYLKLLQEPEPDHSFTDAWFSEQDGKKPSEEYDAFGRFDTYSIRDVLIEYLHSERIPKESRPRKDKQTSERSALILSAMQKSIRNHWPDEIALSKMKNRATDVTRKVLILLFIATDGYAVTEYDEFETDLSREEEFEDMYERMNNMLNECGFAPLDPRAPFDWMMLFCMCAGAKDFIDLRIERFLQAIFPDTPQ